MSRKLTRQFSLQCDSPPLPHERKPILRKQHSEEVPREENDLRIRISLSAKNRGGNSDKPPGLKIAWEEERNEDKEEIKNSKIEPVLSAKQDLEERFNHYWKNKEKSKQNLNIILNHNTNEEENLFKFEEDVSSTIPKIIPPLQPNLQEVDLKNIFQKQIRKNARNANSTSLYSPTRSNDAPNRSVVVVPIIERNKPMLVPRQDNDEILQPPVDEKPINVILRPATAQSKREMFQKRTNSAFQSSIKNDFRPPLVRASSVPTKIDAKPKFFTNKRRVKSAKRKEKRGNQEEEDEDEEGIKSDNNKKGDIVTMVSLISPSGSDNEEDVVIQPSNNVSPKKCNHIKKEEQTKHFPVRKVSKQVSFQQSSIHAVRSFSASFPTRRGSVATTLLLGNAVKKLNNHLQRNQERRNVSDDEQVGPKRRLVRSSSTSRTKVDSNLTPPSTQVKPLMEVTVPEMKVVENSVETKNEQTPKEKECWEMYCKMNERGLTISFDTILRGMLTPTEYRLRSKITEQSDDNCR